MLLNMAERLRILERENNENDWIDDEVFDDQDIANAEEAERMAKAAAEEEEKKKREKERKKQREEKWKN